MHGEHNTRALCPASCHAPSLHVRHCYTVCLCPTAYPRMRKRINPTRECQESSEHLRRALAHKTGRTHRRASHGRSTYRGYNSQNSSSRHRSRSPPLLCRPEPRLAKRCVLAPKYTANRPNTRLLAALLPRSSWTCMYDATFVHLRLFWLLALLQWQRP